MKAWLELLRISNLPTVWTNVIAGMVFASAFASSFALRRLRKSVRQLECCTCSMRTWMRFLAMRPPICEGKRAPRV